MTVKNFGPGSKPVAQTSRWMAAARARENERSDRLFHDPLAAELAGPEGFAWLGRTDPPGSLGGPGVYAVVRTRFFDDFLQTVCQDSEVRQVVLVAAGLDTRAFRLDWAPGTRLYELDLPEVLDYKKTVVRDAGAKARCLRRPVGVDLEEPDWSRFLRAAGYRPDKPSVWILEGFLFYLDRSAVEVLLQKIDALAADSSFLGVDIMNRQSLLSPMTWPLLTVLDQSGAPAQFGTEEPEKLLARHGWKAEVTQPGEKEASFGRWPTPALPRWVAGFPRAFLARARRS